MRLHPKLDAKVQSRVQPQYIVVQLSKPQYIAFVFNPNSRTALSLAWLLLSAEWEIRRALVYGRGLLSANPPIPVRVDAVKTPSTNLYAFGVWPQVELLIALAILAFPHHQPKAAEQAKIKNSRCMRALTQLDGWFMEDLSFNFLNWTRSVANPANGFAYRLWPHGFMKVSADLVAKTGEIIKLPTTKLGWAFTSEKKRLDGHEVSSWDPMNQYFISSLNVMTSKTHPIDPNKG